MPTSSFDHVSSVMHIVEKARPRSILDVGIGFGKWGVLCREILEAKHGRLQPADWQTRIDGIEIYQQYENPLWHLAYENVFPSDVIRLIDELGYYDLILVCDIVEHLDKDVGTDLLGKLLQHAALVVVTSPRGFMVQTALLGNEHEIHLSGWEAKDFARFPHIYWDTGLTFVVAMSSSQSYLSSLGLGHPLRRIGLRTVTRELLRLGKEQLGENLRAKLHLR